MIYLNSTTELDMTNSHLSNLRGVYGGLAYILGQSTVTLTDCEFSDFHARRGALIATQEDQRVQLTYNCDPILPPVQCSHRISLERCTISRNRCSLMDSEYNSPPTGEFPIGGSILYSTGVHTQTNFSMLDCSVTDNGAVGQELGIDSRGGCFLLENGSEV